MLRKSVGNMYNFVDFTWNPIRGKCPHECKYCFMKRFPQGELRLDEKELKTDLGIGKTIFVGSSTDMFADKVPSEWIRKVLEHCLKYPNNTYLFQTKNPERFVDFYSEYPEKTIFGTTIETNRENNLDKSPPRTFRLMGMTSRFLYYQRKMLTIEPIIDFDVEIFVDWVKHLRPEFVNIGADSKNSNLPEPSKEKIEKLIEELNKFTKVRIKDNLKRLMK